MKTKTATQKSSRKPNLFNGTSLAAQRQRLIKALSGAPDGLTTIELREQCDIMMPAARVYELRWMFGRNIVRSWVYDTNAQGYRHKVACYVLLSGQWRDAA